MTLDELIGKLRARPGMFLGDDLSAQAIHHFIDGFLICKQNNNLSIDKEEHFNESYRNFIIKEYSNDQNINEIKYKTMWFRMIDVLSSSANESLELFFALYDKFTNEIDDVN